MKNVFKKIAVITLLLAMVLCLCGCDSSDYKKAVSLMESGDYAAAEQMFTKLGDYEDSAEKILECRYALAVAAFEKGEYELAISAFEALDSYNDSAEKVLECRYALAVAAFEKGEYELAISAFEELGNYKDCEAKSEESKTIITEQKYNEAVALMSGGKYVDAGFILKDLNYKDSAEKYAECMDKAAYEMTNIGDIITFGHYEQDNNRDNGPEPIDWRVLDKEDGKVLVISDKGLEMLPYFAIYWKRSHIGGWLNGPFLYDFTAEEKAMIVETTVTADKHPDKPETDQGANTEHGMYLLSVDEVEKYLPNEEDRVCYATEYLKAQFIDTIHLDGLEEDGRCDWWLRTAYTNYSSGAIISIIGGGGTFGWATHGCRLALRPVCWIQLEG